MSFYRSSTQIIRGAVDIFHVEMILGFLTADPVQNTADHSDLYIISIPCSEIEPVFVTIEAYFVVFSEVDLLRFHLLFLELPYQIHNHTGKVAALRFKRLIKRYLRVFKAGDNGKLFHIFLL